MRLDSLKKKLIREGAILGGIIALLSIIFGYLSYLESSLKKELATIESESRSMLREASDTENENNLIINSFKHYQTIPATQRSTPSGYSSLPSRIREAGPKIESLSNRFKFAEVDRPSFTQIKEEPENLGVKAITVYTNKITLNFRALTDELVYSFCEAMIKELPGYLSVEKMELKRDGDITPEVIQQVRNRYGEPPSLVSGRLVFNWRTFKSAPVEK